MPFTRAQAEELFPQLFRILLADDEFSSRMRAGGLSLLVIHTKPDLQVYVDPDGVRVDGVPGPAVVTIKMSCDTAHALWSGQLLMPIALATGKVRIKGSVARVLEFVPILRPAFDRYPELAAATGVPA